MFDWDLWLGLDVSPQPESCQKETLYILTWFSLTRFRLSAGKLIQFGYAVYDLSLADKRMVRIN